jgi:Domain of unknown function (DUF4349)
MTGPETAELEAVDAALAGRPVAPEHAELAELALLLRDERPEPTLTWTTQLDRRVEAGFPARPKEPPRWRMWLHPGTLGPVVAVGLVVALVVGAALSGGGGDADEGASGGGSAGSAEMAQPSSAEEPAATLQDAARSGGNPGSDARDRRDVERSAAITLAGPPREIDKMASEAGRIASDLGGFVSSSRVTSRQGGDLLLRVPSSRLDTAIQRLSDLGRVRDLSRQSEDITAVVVSARERLTDARAERESLLRQLAAATTVNETESIRARLRIVSREIAGARARLRSANNRARFADVRVTLAASQDASDDEEGTWTPGDAFDDALRVLEVMAGVALIALAVSLPLLVAGGLGWGASRGLRRRRRERALDMA